ncbi:MAG TPA: winged helix-turn-helix domain-containing protein [Rickettsiales bacterium]|nr:winged helix-turn-helix domain-containing protein [Rickettsiales bacterium]
MEAILVISNEPALAETLASELGEFSLTPAAAQEAAALIQNGSYDLIIIDNETNFHPDITNGNIIKLIRPVRLNEAIYTIRQKLKSKTAQAKEEIALAPDCLFNMAERTLRTPDNSGRILLTDKETELLQYLISPEPQKLSRDMLLKQIWGYGESINTHTLETHIYRLRTKLRQISQSLDISFSEEEGYRLK